MAYKDIETRRIYRGRYKAKNPLKTKERDNRHARAQKCHPVRQPCSMEGCGVIGERHHPDPDKWEEITWLCKEHHVAEHCKVERKCTFKGCDSRHHAKDYCRKHYWRIKAPPKPKTGGQTR